MVKITAPLTPATEPIFSKEALSFIEELHWKFNPKREELLKARQECQKKIDGGLLPAFLDNTLEMRKQDWKVAPCPKDLEDRRVEITGPVDRKMLINALNSGAKVFMADLEDANSPTWENVSQGQQNLFDAVRRNLDFTSPEGKSYKLNDKTATLVVRPRGWHLEEKHLLIDGKAASASLVDFGLYFFHNAKEALKRGTGPYFYLPKMESHHEARLWNDVFIFAQEKLGIPRGTIRATVLIETILAVFEMEEILYELREHASGLNAGRWDYIFSMIKKFRNSSDFILPDRSQVTMAVPFMKGYAELLVYTCHKRGAHAIGGMAAFIPNRKDPEVTEKALKKVQEDKEREANAGFDGTWVAHPDLVSVAQAIFDRKLGSHSNQKDVKREDAKTPAKTLLDVRIDGGKITEDGVRVNINVGLQYIERWLAGVGAAAIHNLMEDAATAEISRAQLWQWIHHKIKLDDGRTITEDLYKKIRDEEITKLDPAKKGIYVTSAQLLDELVLGKQFAEFLTIPAYRYLT